VEKVPFIACSLVSSVLTIIAQKGAIEQMKFVPLPARLLVGAKAFVDYLGKMAVPLGLSPFYPYPKQQQVVTLFSPQYLLAVISVVGISTVLLITLITAKKQKVWLTAWGYYVVTLIPVSGIIQVGAQAMADRYTYLPSLGPFFLLGLIAASGWAKADSVKKGGLIVKLLTVVVAISLLISLSCVTLKHIATWKNSITLWSYVIEEDPRGVAFAYTNRGLAFHKMGQLDRALEDYTAAITLQPNEYLAYTNRGITFKEMGQLDRAIEDYTSAIAVKPTLYSAYNNRGIAFHAKGQLDRAMQDYNTAIALKPFLADAYTNRGWVFEEMGQLDRAIQDYDTAIALAPSQSTAYNNRGIAFKKMGQLDRAIQDYNTAIALEPASYLAYTNRGIALKEIGQFDRAIQDYTRVLSLNPTFINAYLDRGELYQKTGSVELAVRDYQRACDLGSKEGCDALGTYRKQGPAR
jgi:tetratricopeptide (TPR) repeat protein